MKKNLRFLMLTLLCAVFSVAWGEEVTLDLTDASIYSKTGTSGSGSEVSATDQGITINASKGYLDSGANLRLYSGSSFEISSSLGNITKVEITCTTSGTSNYGPSKLDVKQGGTGGDYTSSTTNVGTWTGDAEIVQLVATAQCRVTQITITYSSSNKQDAIIQPIDDISLPKGETRQITISTNSDGIIHVVSGNTSLVTVSGSGATWTITAVEKGTATITVSQDASDDFKKPNDVTFTVTVTANLPANCIFYESFDTNDGTGGNDGKWSGTIAQDEIDNNYDNEGWTFANGNGAKQCIKLGTSNKRGSATTPGLDVTGDAILTFRAAAWNTSSEGTTINLSVIGECATISPNSITLAKGQWTDYTINISGMLSGSKIKFEAKNSSNNRFFLDEVIVAFVPENVDVTIRNVGYASLYYGTKNLTVPTGVTATTYTLTSENKPTISKTYNAGDVIPAGEGVILQGSANTYTFNQVASTTATKDANNKLKGSDTDEEWTTGPGGEEDGYKFYVLSAEEDGSNPGFYWYKENGGRFKSAAHKVYLPIPIGSGDTSSFTFDDMNGIRETMISNTQTGDVYTISGVKVTGNQLQKGLYIINGKKVVIK